MSERKDESKIYTAMGEHLNIERISALLDEPWADLDAEAHLERCALCRAEYERLSRMRMAVSALGELSPPENAWQKIEARLDGVGVPGRASPARSRAARWTAVSWPLQAAAAAVLFAGGALAGWQLTTGGGRAAADRAAANDAPAQDATGLPVALPRSSQDAAFLGALAELEALRFPLRQAGSAGPDAPLDPLAVTQWIAGLDGAIRAMQERLERSPGDPVVNAYLFQMVEERNRVAGRLERAVHQTQAVEW